MREMCKNEILKRTIFLLCGLFILSFGVALSIKADLGTSPISSLPYVASIITPLTVGQLTIIMHCVFILLQKMILKKQYEPVQLLQLPVAFIFGGMTDLSLFMISRLHAGLYWQQWVICIAGILLVALGVSFEVTAKIVPLAGEGLSLAISKVTSIDFGYVKIMFDVTLVLSALILSFAFTSRLHGIGLGTIAAAVSVGMIAKRINKLMLPVEKNLLTSGDIKLQ